MKFLLLIFACVAIGWAKPDAKAILAKAKDFLEKMEAKKKAHTRDEASATDRLMSGFMNQINSLSDDSVQKERAMQAYRNMEAAALADPDRFEAKAKVVLEHPNPEENERENLRRYERDFPVRPEIEDLINKAREFHGLKKRSKQEE